MTIRYSTGFRNALLKRNGWRALLNEGVIRIYSGSQPSSPNSAATGTLLCVITKNSGAFVAGTKSTRQADFVKITAGTAGERYTITIGSNIYAYTMVGGDTASTIAQGLCALIDADPDVDSIPTISTTEKGVVLEAKLAGEAYTVSVSCTASVGSMVLSNMIANSRYNGLHFGSVSAGVISKETAYNWTGSGLVDGIAGWFRFSENADDPTTISTTAVRMDGSIGSSGADMSLGSTNIQANGAITLSAADFTNPIE